MAVGAMLAKSTAGALVLAALVAPVQGTAGPFYGFTEYLEDVDCEGNLALQDANGNPLEFSSEAEAQAACSDRGLDECYGVYDTSCDGTGFRLCSAAQVSSTFDYGASSPACVSRMQEISTTGTTTTLLPTTAAPAATTEVMPSGAAPVPAAAAAATSATAAGAATTSLPACEAPCALSAGEAESSCREQILGFSAASSSSGGTGSMPATDVTCEAKRAIVAGLGSCGQCSACDVCETTAAAATAAADGTRLWKLSDGDAAEPVEAGGLAAGGLRRGPWPLLAVSLAAGLAAVAALLGAAAVALRRGGAAATTTGLLSTAAASRRGGSASSTPRRPTSTSRFEQLREGREQLHGGDSGDGDEA